MFVRILLLGFCLLLSQSSVWAKPIKVLFVGNSFTQGPSNFNAHAVTDTNGKGLGGVPAIFKHLTEEGGRPEFDVSLETIPGEKLATHFHTKAEIIGQSWDYVILQEYSTYPLSSFPKSNLSSFRQAVHDLASLVRSHNPAVKIILYETWARPDLVPNYYTSLQGMQSELHTAYFTAARDINATACAPVGDAFLRALAIGIAYDPKSAPESRPPGSFNLWGNDNYHHNHHGGYLSALIFYTLITGQDPRQLPTDSTSAAAALSVPAADATRLQTLAYDITRPAPAITENPPPRPAAPASAGDELPLRPTALYRPLSERYYGNIQVGSALDFSFLIEPGPAGQHGFAQVRPDGHFVFQNRPEQPVRFLQATTLMMSWWPYRSQEQIEAFADQIVRNGYNLVRTHFLDQMLMLGSDQPTVFDRQQLDLFDRLTAALKKRGVYLYVDLTTDGALFDAFKDRSAKRDGLLAFKMYWDPAARQHWRDGVKALLQHVNPYTGVALKDEPQVIAFEARNEKGIHFLLGLRGNKPERYPAFLAENYRHWLQKKYGTFAALQSAWAASGGEPAAGLIHATGFSDLGYPDWNRGPDFPDFMRFVLDSERALYAWEASALSELGTHVPLVDFNVISSAQTALVRFELPIVENHGYHDHTLGGPQGYERAGASLRNDSLLASAGKDFLGLVGSRLAGHAFLATEWGMPYWNEFRHENALFAPAYAAFQDIDLLSHHGWPVALGQANFIRVFHTFNDPTIRVGERASALLFLRRDVSPAVGQTTIAMDEKIAWSMGPTNNINNDLLRAGLVTGLSIAAPRPATVGQIQFTPGRGVGQQIILGAAVNDSGGDASIQAQWLLALRQAHRLPAQNRTDVERSRYESDTGELYLDAQAATFRLDTPRTVGGVFTAATRKLETARLRVMTDGTPLSLSASSLDASPLEKSRRILILAATDSRNSGMRTEVKNGRSVLLDPGAAPVELRTFHVRLALRHESAALLHAWALREDGARQESLPVHAKDGWAEIEVDTATLKGGPVSYLELAVP